MKGEYLTKMLADKFKKRYAFLVCLMLFMQECNAKTFHRESLLSELVDDFNDIETNFHDNDIETKFDDNDLDTTFDVADIIEGEDNQRDKRWAVPALVGIAALSGGFNIYQQEFGCKPTNPELFTNVAAVEKKRLQVTDMRRAQIPFWNKVINAQGYLERLAGSLTIVFNLLSKIRQSESDIASIFDQNFFKKLNATSTNLEQQLMSNTSYPTDPASLLANFFTDTEYAVTIATKFSIVGLYLGGTFFGPIIVQRLSRVLANEKIAGLISRLRPRLTQSFPRLNPRFGGSLASSGSRLSTALRAFSQIGQFAITGLFLAYEVYLAWRYFTDCDRKQRESRGMLQLADASIANMTRLTNEIQNFHGYIVGNYSKVYEVVASSTFLNAMKDAQQLDIKSQAQTATMEANANKYQQFIDGIGPARVSGTKFNFVAVARLVQILTNALQTTARKLDCYRRKVSRIAKIKQDCGFGLTTKDALATLGVQEAQSIAHCSLGSGIPTKGQFIKLIDDLMVTEGKSTICLRNSAIKQNLVCNALSGGPKSSATIQQSIEGGITVADVDYFRGKCVLAQLTPNMEATICFMKSQNQDLVSVKNSFSSYDQKRVEVVYTSVCKLSQKQVTRICQDKTSGKTLSELQLSYKFYTDLTNVYNACVAKPTVNDINNICLFSRLISNGDAKHNVHARAVTKFGLATVQSIIDTQCK